MAQLKVFFIVRKVNEIRGLIKELVAPLGTKFSIYHFKAESVLNIKYDVIKL